MSIFSELSLVSTYIGIPATTVFKCIEKDQTTKKYKFSKNAAENTAKKVGLTTLVGSVSTVIQHCAENRTLNSAQLYQESLTDDQIYEFEQLLTARETEFSVNGKTFDLAEFDIKSAESEVVTSKETKVLQKSIDF